MKLIFSLLAPICCCAVASAQERLSVLSLFSDHMMLPKIVMVSTPDIGYLKIARPPYKQEVGNRSARFTINNEYGLK